MSAADQRWRSSSSRVSLPPGAIEGSCAAASEELLLGMATSPTNRPASAAFSRPEVSSPKAWHSSFKRSRGSRSSSALRSSPRRAVRASTNCSRTRRSWTSSPKASAAC